MNRPGWTWPTCDHIARAAVRDEILRLVALLPAKQQAFFRKACIDVPPRYSLDHGDLDKLRDILQLTQRSIDAYAEHAP